MTIQKSKCANTECDYTTEGLYKCQECQKVYCENDIYIPTPDRKPDPDAGVGFINNLWMCHSCKVLPFVSRFRRWTPLVEILKSHKVYHKKFGANIAPFKILEFLEAKPPRQVRTTKETILNKIGGEASDRMTRHLRALIRHGCIGLVNDSTYAITGLGHQVFSYWSKSAKEAEIMRKLLTLK